jgi:glycosyltransferase involved in cell wall biosynthesis
MMRVTLVSTMDGGGGAARAAAGLHRDLLARPDVEPTMVVQQAVAGTPAVVTSQSRIAGLRAGIDRLPVRPFPGRAATFSPQWLPGDALQRISATRPDVVNVHWAQGGFLRVEDVPRLAAPIVWTLNDMWAFTGGCHYSGACRRYETTCGACPVLRSPLRRDTSTWIQRRKLGAWRDVEVVAVAPALWIAEAARASAVLRDARIEVIANSVDTDVFRPRSKAASRALLGLPADARIVLFGAALDEPRKGWAELQQALGLLGASDEATFVTFGPRTTEAAVSLGTIDDDDRLAAAYSAADVFVSPSLEDVGPLTVQESLACGTPVVAFAAGGALDFLEGEQTGRLVPVGDTRAFAEAIRWMLADDNRRRALGAAGRAKAGAEWALSVQGERYTALYRSLI